MQRAKYRTLIGGSWTIPLELAPCARPIVAARARPFHSSPGQAEDNNAANRPGSSRPTRRQLNREAGQQLQNLRPPGAGPPIARHTSAPKELQRRQQPTEIRPRRPLPTKPRRGPPRGAPSSPAAPLSRRRRPSARNDGAEHGDEDGDISGSRRRLGARPSLTQEEIIERMRTRDPTKYLERAHRDAFDTEGESRNYGRLMEYIEEINTKQDRAAEVAAMGRKKADERVMAEAEGLDRQVDEVVREALARTERTRDEILVPYEPAEVLLGKGEVGYAPVGAAGLGSVVEDGVQLLGGRDGERWRDPKLLAERLGRGEFVQFRSELEKKEVGLRLSDLVGKAEEGNEIKGAVFEPLSEGARKEMVERLVGGQYEDVRDRELGSEVERKVASMVNGYYPSRAKETMLKNLREMMPPPPRMRS